MVLNDFKKRTSIGFVYAQIILICMKAKIQETHPFRGNLIVRKNRISRPQEFQWGVDSKRCDSLAKLLPSSMLKTVHSIYIKCKNFNLKYCYFGRILSEIARYTAFSILFLLLKAKNSYTIATNTSLSAARDMSIFVLSFPALSTLHIFYPTSKRK